MKLSEAKKLYPNEWIAFRTDKDDDNLKAKCYSPTRFCEYSERRNRSEKLPKSTLYIAGKFRKALSLSFDLGISRWLLTVKKVS